jgi:hypothetical protein
LTGFIAPTTIPSCTLYLQNVVSGYRTNFYYPSFTDVASPADLPSAPTPNTTFNYMAYDTSGLPIVSVHWVLNISNANSAYISSYTGFTAQPSYALAFPYFIMDGYVSRGIYPSVTINMSNTVAGYSTSYNNQLVGAFQISP